ncbi:hypothetical protein [Frankia sp. CiP3]|uniref:hypothetical protein n=1 Tax=Frankia sp. CiP3 TaxID=2880971 RepID=UPI001EF3E63B|nr:hypothetical protein [Frankia sp. CiP3]
MTAPARGESGGPSEDLPPPLSCGDAASGVVLPRQDDPQEVERDGQREDPRAADTDPPP